MNTRYPFGAWYSDSLARQSLRVVSYATEEQVSLEQAQQHLRLDLYGSPPSHPDDSLIENVYLPAARAYCEVISGRAFVPQTYELGIGAFPRPFVAYSRGGIALPIGPVTSVTSITYTDSAGVEQTLAASAYTVDPYTEPGYCYPVANTYWPDTLDVPNAVKVRFQAGYDLPSSSPQDNPFPPQYRAAVLLMLAHYYENRAQVDTMPNAPRELVLGVQTLIGPDALRKGFA